MTTHLLKVFSLSLIIFYRIESAYSLEASLCDLDEYRKISQPYEDLMRFPKIKFREFPKGDSEKLRALKESRTLDVSESCLIEWKKDTPENFIFSPHIVDCVGLVVTQNMPDQRRIFVAHFARDSKEKLLADFQSHNFSPSDCTVLMITSVQSDVLLFTFQQFKQKGFRNIFTQFGPFVRFGNKFHVPSSFFAHLPKDANIIRQHVKQWTTSTLIFGTTSNDLYVYEKDEDWLDSDKILQLKTANT